MSLPPSAHASPGTNVALSRLVLLLLALLVCSYQCTLLSVSALPAVAASAAPLLCLNGGVLLRTPAARATGSSSSSSSGASKALVDVQCACADGWSGTTCEYRDWCAVSNPCQNDGQCFNTRVGALCHCSDEWAGPTCAQPSPCRGDPCSGHGMCLLREVKDDDADSSAAAPGSAADARVLPERRRAKPSRRHKIAAPKSDEPAVENNSTTVGFRHFRSRVTGHCRCELGWTGRDCSQPHAEVCAKVNKCSIFNAQQDADGTSLCGCESAIVEHRCVWCLEQGVAFAPGLPSAAASSCLAPLDNAAQCPPAAAQTIRSCKLMDGTPFGWCVVAQGPLGYSVDGNPTAPTSGSRGCRHWIWNLEGCKTEWGTRQPSDEVASAPPTPELSQCLAVPPCSDAETAGSSVCGCQAALSIGCTWCLEQQMAYPPGHPNLSSCRATANQATQCPSQQAQTVHQCVGVGGTPYGWCSIDEQEQSMGYSLDGTSKSPASNPRQCLRWFFYSNACPEHPANNVLNGGGDGVGVVAGGGVPRSVGFLRTTAALVITLAETKNSNSAADGDDDDAAAAEEPVLTPKQRLEAERAAVSPPQYMTTQTRNYMLVWLSLVALALFLRWLPHYLERSEYRGIRDKPITAQHRDDVANASSTL